MGNAVSKNLKVTKLQNFHSGFAFKTSHYSSPQDLPLQFPSRPPTTVPLKTSHYSSPQDLPLQFPSRPPTTVPLKTSHYSSPLDLPLQFPLKTSHYSSPQDLLLQFPLKTSHYSSPQDPQLNLHYLLQCNAPFNCNKSRRRRQQQSVLFSSIGCIPLFLKYVQVGY